MVKNWSAGVRKERSCSHRSRSPTTSGTGFGAGWSSQGSTSSPGRLGNARAAARATPTPAAPGSPRSAAAPSAAAPPCRKSVLRAKSSACRACSACCVRCACSARCPSSTGTPTNRGLLGTDGATRRAPALPRYGVPRRPPWYRADRRARAATRVLPFSLEMCAAGHSSERNTASQPKTRGERCHSGGAHTDRHLGERRPLSVGYKSSPPMHAPNPQRRDDLARVQAEIEAVERAPGALPDRASEERASLREELRRLRSERAALTRQR